MWIHKTWFLWRSSEGSEPLEPLNHDHKSRRDQRLRIAVRNKVAQRETKSEKRKSKIALNSGDGKQRFYMFQSSYTEEFK